MSEDDYPRAECIGRVDECWGDCDACDHRPDCDDECNQCPESGPVPECLEE